MSAKPKTTGVGCVFHSIGGKEGCYFGGRMLGEFLLKLSVFTKVGGEVIL